MDKNLMQRNQNDKYKLPNWIDKIEKSKNRIASEYRSMASIDETIWAEIKENGTQDIPTNTHTPTHIYTYTSWEMI